MSRAPEHPRITRRAWLVAAAGTVAAATGVDAFGIEPRRVTITRHSLGAPTGPLLRLVQLSDLHLRSIGRHEEQIADAVHALQPDLLVRSGDAIDRTDSVPLLSSFLSLLPETAHRVAILGNWEHWARLNLADVRRRYATRGWTLLENASTHVTHRGADLLITGLDDLIGGRPDVGRAIDGVVPSRNHLLLAHCPAQRDALTNSVFGGMPAEPESASPVAATLAPQLMLSGHTHGGQLAIGGWAPMRPPGSGRYVAGWYRDAGVPLYVSRGLGTSVVPARFGAPPEVAVFDWRLSV